MGIGLGMGTGMRRGGGAHKTFTFADAFTSGTLATGWDSSITQNTGSTIQFVTDPILGTGQCLAFKAGADNGTQVGKAHLIKEFPKARRGSRVTIQFDIVPETQPATDIYVCDLECSVCYTTNPGIRLGLSSDKWRLERSKLGEFTTANTDVTSPNGAWQTVKWVSVLGGEDDGFNELTFDGDPAPSAYFTNMPLFINGPFTDQGVDRVQIGLTANSADAARTVALKNFSVSIVYGFVPDP